MLTDEQKQAIHNETGAGYALICLVEFAATAPLLAEIERLKERVKELETQPLQEEPRHLWDGSPMPNYIITLD